MIKNVEENLDYLLIKCSPEEYNHELAAAYINLLSPDTPQIVDLPDNHTPTKIYIPPTSPTPFKKIAVIGIATVACIATLLISVSNPSVATRKQGFFYWIKRDKTGASFITNPEAMETESLNHSNHNSAGYYKHIYTINKEGIRYELYSQTAPVSAGVTKYIVVFYFKGKRYALSNINNPWLLVDIAMQYYRYISAQ